MEDFFFAGGLGAVMRELKPLLNLDCMTVTGETLGERLAATKARSIATSSPSAPEPLEPQGGLVALFGSLAPARRDPEALRRRQEPVRAGGQGGGLHVAGRSGRARRRSRARHHRRRLSWCCRMPVRSASGMPEAGYLPIPKKLAYQGVKDMVRISDARMSGTAFGTIVLHVTPDAASGGPLALVRDGDRIRLSVQESNNRSSGRGDGTQQTRRRTSEAAGTAGAGLCLALRPRNSWRGSGLRLRLSKAALTQDRLYANPRLRARRANSALTKPGPSV